MNRFNQTVPIKYFENILQKKHQDDFHLVLKQEYKRLAFIHHPDKGGSTEAMQNINLEYEQLAKADRTKYGYDFNSEISFDDLAEFLKMEGVNIKPNDFKNILILIDCFLSDIFRK